LTSSARAQDCRLRLTRAAAASACARRMIACVTACVDGTQGCIAVGSDDAIDAIAAWVESHEVKTVHIR